MASALEKIADLLVQKKLLTREQLEACIREVNESQGSGKPLLLSEVIVSKGYADRPTLAQTVQLLAEVKFRCSKCRTPYNIRSPKIDGAYRCKRCGAPLETEDIVPSQGAPSVPAPKPGGPPPEVAEAAKDPKRVMGKYTLVNELGRGGMAVVYKAWDEQLDQFVALKLIRSQDIGLSDQPEDATVQEFLREARTAVKLQHQNIVRVYELGRHGDRYFLSMEYVQGKSLAQLLRTSRETRALPFYADIKRFLGYLRDVARALDYSHRRTPPIVHRDIKPQNILVDDGGRVCVVDFGLAKELKGAGNLTRSGIAKGTPCYMAPEQATGKPIDARTDVYALGAVLYECMTGQPPFTGPSERDILNKILGEEASSPTAVLKGKGILAPSLPDLERICLKALEKPLERRYGSAGEFAADLERFLEGQSVQARPVSGLERSWRWLMKRKAVAISTASAVLMALVAAAVLLRDKNERIVERVKIVGDVDPEKKAALEAIERLEAQFRYEAAARACEDLLRQVREEGQRTSLRQKRDDLRLQAEFFKALASRIGPGIPDQPAFRLIGEPPFDARFLQADAESLRLQKAGRPISVAWWRVDPRQIVTLAKVAWPEMDGKSTLAMGVWCLRQGLSDEATTFFSRPGAALDSSESKRYQDELKSKELNSALSDTEQVTRLVSEAEQALAKEDAIIARARFERALVLSKDDPRILRGLEKVAELEKRQEAAKAPTPEASPTPQPPVAEKLPDAKAAESAAAGEIVASQSNLLVTLRKGDLAGAAARWDEAQKHLGPRAVRFTRLPGALDLKAGRPLLDEVELWLSATTGDDSLALRQVFVLRDLLALSLALGDFHPAVDRLIKAKMEVPIYSLDAGQEKKGTFERTRGKLYFNEIIDVGGQKGTFGIQIGLPGEEGKNSSLVGCSEHPGLRSWAPEIHGSGPKAERGSPDLLQRGRCPSVYRGVGEGPIREAGRPTLPVEGVPGVSTRACESRIPAERG
jgi:serine/threonine protein kinase